MSRHLTDDFKELVRRQTDILSLVQDSVVLRPQRGGKDYVGLCPFHDDHNPSMHVYTDRQSFRCWVCEAGGDCFSFVMRRDKVGFREALEFLAQRAGLEIPQNYRAPGPAGPDAGTRTRLYEIVGWAEREFHEYLLSSADADRARRYLRERGISGDSISRFRLGYHPDDWEWLIGRARGKYSLDELATVKLIQKREGRTNWSDCFVDRVIFPIRDAQRRPVAFGGRILPDSRYQGGGKYINSAEHPLFQKSKLVYGLDEARETITKSDMVVVTEGYTDCIAAHQHGLKNFVGTLGTALNEQHVMLLKRFARRMVLLFDGDEAGQRATEKALPRFLAHEVDLRTLTLPGGQDPAEYLEEHGADELRSLLRQSVEAWEYKYRLVVERYGLDSIDSRHRVLQEMLEILAEVPVTPGTGLAGTWREREQVILGRLAQRLKVGEGFIRDRLSDLRTSQQQRGAAPQPVPASVRTEPAADWSLPARPSRDERAELDLLLALFTHPRQAERAVAEVVPADFTHRGLRQLYEVCWDMVRQQQPPSFERVSLAIEDRALLCLAVDVDVLARESNPAADLLEHSLAYFRKRHELEAHRSSSEPELAEVPAGGESSEPAGAAGLDSAALERLRRATMLHRTRTSRQTSTPSTEESARAPAG